MNRTVHVSTAMMTAIALTVGMGLTGMGSALAQLAPHLDRLTPLQRQQFSRDLSPSGAQDFFKAGQVTLEQEVRLLTRPRSPLNEKLLNVRQSPQPQQNEHGEQPDSLLHNRAR